MIKALFVIWSLEKGGAERFLSALLKSLDRKKIEPVVCCLNWKGLWADEVEKKGIRVIALNKKGKFDIGSFLKLIAIMRQGKFDIVNTYLWAADVLGRIAAVFAGIPVIVSTAQNVDIWKRLRHRLMDKILSYKTDMLIAVSAAVKDYYHKKAGIPLSKITVIPNAIEIERFNPNGNSAYLYEELQLNRGDFILSCIGRLTEQKGQSYLLESAFRLSREHPDLKVLLVGDGEDREKLASLARDFGIESMVRFTGQRRDIAQILHISCALVLPSIYEGLPVCVLEAMASEKPVIATDVGGTKDLVVDKETGFLIPPKDSAALTLAVKNLINLPDKGKQMGKKAKAVVVKNYSIQSAAQKTEDLFLSLTNNRK